MFAWASTLFYGNDDDVMKEARKTGKSPTAIAIDKNRQAIAAQRQRVTELENRIARDTASAKQAAAAKNKPRAIQYLKRVKLQRAQLDKIENVIFNLEQQSSAIEETDFSMRTVDSMKTAAATMKTMQSNPDDIQETMDDISEIFQEASDISDRLAEGLGGSSLDLLDDDDLEAELDGLLDEENHQPEEPTRQETLPLREPEKSMENAVFPLIPATDLSNTQNTAQETKNEASEQQEDPYADLISQLQQL